ncbi:MAG: glycoside hydrolase family 99-like domain-containing protein [Gluconacetobacter diazotrophicus]|nr:glycoside hydrolase family 99-like domain-containing protein [Gluconacetobacter diazotrophicus]
MAAFLALAGALVLFRPVPAAADPVRVVMESCDLWSTPATWRSVLRRAPRNQPASGPYDDTRPDTTDRHAAALLSAGITADQSCWYRARGNAGHPVVPIHDGFIRAMAAGGGDRDRLSWSLFWDNSNPAGDGVSGASDFLDHLVPFWIDTYFRRSNYLRLDGRPVLVISSPRRLLADLGGPVPARAAIAAFRARIRDAGLPGLLLFASNNADPAADNHLAHDLGFDAVMAYATPIFTGLLRDAAPSADAPSDDAVMRAERSSWAAWQRSSAIPSTITVSNGFDARIWSDGRTHYRLSPPHLAELLRDGIRAAADRPPGSPGHRLLFLDNWNEYGEGHFIEPSLAFGDADLRAVAAVLRSADALPRP